MKYLRPGKLSLRSIALLGVISSLAAEVEFGGALFFKGVTVGETFEGRKFSVRGDEDSFDVTCKTSKQEFSFPIKVRIISDVVISHDCRAAAAWSRPSAELRDKRRSIATLTAAGVLRKATYASGEMTEDWEWIIELGSVSPDGRFVLAKCAKLIPVGDGPTGYVNHKWAVFRIEDGNIKIVEDFELEDAILRWPAYIKEGDDQDSS